MKALEFLLSTGILLLGQNWPLLDSALLTDIYERHKLSEIVDPSNKYLILPSSSSSSNSSRLFFSQQQSLALPWKSTPSSHLESGNQNSSSRLKTASTGTLQDASSTSISSSGNTKQVAADTQQDKDADDASVTTDVSTDFPNPNINNLGAEITKILKKFFLHGYDKRVRPNYSGPPVLVNISFQIIGISSVDEVQMDFTTDFYFRQKWFDPRLEFKPVGKVDELCVGAEFAEKIWLPDTFFANEKTATFHRATTENTFIRLGHNGRVYRSIRLTVTCSCPMDLQYFPMDRQRCKIEIESYGYGTRDIVYRWENGNDSIKLNSKIELPQFKILGLKMDEDLQLLSSGEYIRLYCEIHFVRSMGYYLIQIYIPASLIVIISWVSFWLHRNATPARVALGVTTVLTMTTLMSSTNANMPKVSYIKSIDVFLGTCFVMVFASLLEYASVGYIGKRIAMKRKRLQDLQQMQQHHQKVCVAAAASAAAEAAAALAIHQDNQHTNTCGKFPSSSLPDHHHHQQQQSNSLLVRPLASNQQTSELLVTQTLQRPSATISSNLPAPELYNSKTPQLDQTCNYDSKLNEQQRQQLANLNSLTLGQQSLKRTGAGIRKLRVNPTDSNDHIKTPLLMASQPQNSVETEGNRSQDAIRICGLTPSSIDKHSRVIFPICFVCFHLMYWIIYGHISKQIEDKGPPLIPYVS